MESAQLQVTVETLTRIIFPTLYALAGFIVYRWFMPQLSPLARRLAGLMLVAQALAIGKAIYISPASSFDRWLWQLHSEWNVPATLAATQLALVAAAALVCSWQCKARMNLQALYFLGIGFVFLFLAYDEYFTVHEHLDSWNYYLALGIGVVAATLLIAALSPRRAWKWHFCLLAGLAISALGAIQVERTGSICGDFGFIFIYQCPPNTAWAVEEILEFLGIWLVLVAILCHLSDLSPLSRRLGRMLTVLPPLCFVALIPIAPIWPVAQQSYSQAADVAFASGARLQAYRIEEHKRSFSVHLFLSPEAWDFKGLGYSIHLVDQVSGESLVSRNTQAHQRLEFFLAPGHAPVYRQWKRVQLPPQTPSNQALAVVLTLWHKRAEDIIYERALSSDLRLLSETQVLLDELVLPAAAPAPSAAPIAQFENGFSLGAADLPASARPGENLAISFTWHSSENGRQDYVQYLHLGRVQGGSDSVASGEWFVYDQQPLGARLPTRLWYPGLADSETWQAPLPAELPPGQYLAFTGLYRARDQERLPAADANGAPFLDARVPLGRLTILKIES